MELFYVISGVYFLSILFLLVRGFIVYTMGGITATVFSKENILTQSKESLLSVSS